MRAHALGGIHLLHEFTRALHFRDLLAQQIRYPRRNRHYSVPQMLMALVYPIVLGLDRIETASLSTGNRAAESEKVRA